MRKLELVAERKGEEKALVAAAPEAAPLLARLGEIYVEYRALTPRLQAIKALQVRWETAALLLLRRCAAAEEYGL